MFGMGFLEIFLVLIVAVIALGPEKLPNAAVDIAKMFKKLKDSVDDAKSTLDDELNKSGLKTEAEKFKDTMGIDRLASLNIDTIMDDDWDDKPKKDKKKKKSKEDDKSQEEDTKPELVQQMKSSEPMSVASAPTSVKVEQTITEDKKEA